MYITKARITFRLRRFMQEVLEMEDIKCMKSLQNRFFSAYIYNIIIWNVPCDFDPCGFMIMT